MNYLIIKTEILGNIRVYEQKYSFGNLLEKSFQPVRIIKTDITCT